MQTFLENNRKYHFQVMHGDEFANLIDPNFEEIWVLSIAFPI
jgi:hypothetical protein